MAKKLDFTSQQDNVNDVIDIQLAPSKKKKFRIDGDNSRIIELDPSDLNIINRYKDTYKRLDELSVKVITGAPEEIEGESDYDSIERASNYLTEIDKEMRECVDYIFDSPVSDVCVQSGTMYDPVGGQFMFERVIEVLFGLFETGINDEFQKMSKRVSKHTGKYTKKS